MLPGLRGRADLAGSYIGQAGEGPLSCPGVAHDLLQGDALVGPHPQHAADDGLTGGGGLVGGGVRPLADGLGQLRLHPTHPSVAVYNS